MIGRIKETMLKVGNPTLGITRGGIEKKLAQSMSSLLALYV